MINATENLTIETIGEPKFEDIPEDITDIFVASVLEEILNELITDELK